MAKKITRTGDYVVIHFDEDDIKQALKYWTMERVKSAVPVKMPHFDQKDRIQIIGETEGEVSKADVTEADVSVYPFSAGGRILADFGSVSYFGTAQFCGHQNIVLSAAHMFQDFESGATANSYVFSRAYQSENQAQLLAVKSIAFRQDWRSQEDLRYDYGFAITTDKCNVDYLAYSINCMGGEDVTSIGYPSNYGDCETMQKVDGRRLITQDKTVTCMNENPFEGGSSGGAWLQSGTSKIIGLNSFGYDGFVEMWGPFFDEKFDGLFKFTQGLIE